MSESGISHLQVFDPRRGQDFPIQFSRRKKWSSLDLGLFVVRFAPPAGRGATRPPSLQNRLLNELMAKCIVQTGALGFVSKSPLTSAVARSQGTGTGETLERDGSSLEYFRLDQEAVERRLAHRLALATYEEWIVGSCVERFRETVEQRGLFARTQLLDLEYIWEEHGKLGAVSVFYGETGELLLVTRMTAVLGDGLEALITWKGGT